MTKFLFSLLVVVGSLSAHAQTEKPLTGDTFGSAKGHASMIIGAIDQFSNPETILGKVGIFDGNKVSRAVCAEMGRAIGYAFAIQSAIRFHTPGYSGSEGAPVKKELIQEISNLIRLTDARNSYCIADTGNLDDVKAVGVAARSSAEKIIAIINSIENTSK